MVRRLRELKGCMVARGDSDSSWTFTGFKQYRISLSLTDDQGEEDITHVSPQSPPPS